VDRFPPLDLLLISHDHLDVSTLRLLARKHSGGGPSGLGRCSGTAGTELDWWKRFGWAR
jgi:L-ascorbate metabolism protein UlaG (beta-lactamase superfamily)